MHTDQQQKVKVDIKYLQPGWVVDQHLYSGSTLLLKSGTVISETILSLLSRRGIKYLSVSKTSTLSEFCEIPTSERWQKRSQASQPGSSSISAEEILISHKIDPAVPQAVLETAATELDRVFINAAQDQRVEIDQLEQVVDPVISKFLERPTNTVRLPEQIDMKTYAMNHGLKVGLLYMVIAQDWCSGEQELRDQVYGAVLKDIGNARIDPAILNKPGRLTDEEWEIMKQHPILSTEILKQANASEQMLSIALSHHERLNGTGYPHGLKGDEIDRCARLAAICDTYDALTSNKIYKGRTDAACAIEEIIRECGTCLDADLTNRFIRRVGRYPVGSFVELSTGELAVVVKVNEGAIRCPVVSRIVAADGGHIDTRNELDLSERKKIHITRAVTPDEIT